MRSILPANFAAMLFVLMLVSGMTACTTTSQRSSSVQPSRVAQLEAQGDYAGAAEAYLRLASQARSPLRQDYQLGAVNAYARAGDIVRARNLLDSIDQRRLGAALLARLKLLDAELALSEGNPQRALNATQGLTQPSLPAATQAQAHLLNAEAYLLLGDQQQSARERILLDPLLTDPIAIRDNQAAIVQALASLPDGVLQQMGSRPPEIVSGWAELTLIARQSAQNPELFNERIIDWRHRYRQHPASDDLIASLTRPGVFAQTPGGVAQNGASLIYPQRIALLLPLSGALASAGMAVSDAINAAANAQPGSGRPDIRLYDVAAADKNAEASKILQAYQQAVQDGANFIVGPLQKGAVKTLFTLGPLPVPTLALNYVDENETAPANLYQFGLAPEDEARQVAERAVEDGHARVLVLVPEGDRGNRVLNAFSRRIGELGGSMADGQTYSPKTVDFSGPVRRLLQSSGNGRSRRQDADALFIMAAPAQGRSIHAMLSYFYASDLPAYAISDVYGGSPNSQLDTDLNGLLFLGMPWMLSDNTPQQEVKRTLASQNLNSFNKLKQLYAFGVDAYAIIPNLERLRASPDEHFEGETGSLSLDQGNRVHRHLAWARFQSGQVQVLDGVPGAQQ